MTLHIPEVKLASITPMIYMSMHSKNRVLHMAVINVQSHRGAPGALPELRNNMRGETVLIITLRNQ